MPALATKPETEPATEPHYICCVAVTWTVFHHQRRQPNRNCSCVYRESELRELPGKSGRYAPCGHFHPACALPVKHADLGRLTRPEDRARWSQIEGETR